MPHLGKALSGGWKHLFRNRPRLWYAAAVLLLTLVPLTQFVNLQLKERQLAQREQMLDRMYEKMHEIVQFTEQAARRVEQNLSQQQQTLSSMKANLQETNHLAAQVPTPVVLPLEPAPSP
jgi:hypothetical protein